MGAKKFYIFKVAEKNGKKILVAASGQTCRNRPIGGFSPKASAKGRPYFRKALESEPGTIWVSDKVRPGSKWYTLEFYVDVLFPPETYFDAGQAYWDRIAAAREEKI